MGLKDFLFNNDYSFLLQIAIILLSTKLLGLLTKRISLTEPTRDADRINRSARHVFQEIELTNAGIRLLGVTMTNFVDHTELPLVEEEKYD